MLMSPEAYCINEMLTTPEAHLEQRNVNEPPRSLITENF
jgi:hypothetical protein